MNFFYDKGQWVSDDEMVAFWRCQDGSWRASGYPWHDKIRNMKTREEAKAAAVKWHEEYRHLFG